ncbi:MAG: hypothetical protein FJ098_03590 [Deltaproteobacteria bacterium]|nr:hypothetical protein [Deltaproteobacteria bacterium]
MGFRRRILPAEEPGDQELTSALAGIGFRLAADPRWGTNIEDALYHGSVAGMEHDDLRVLSILVKWLEVHAKRVNADRLVRLAAASPSVRVRAFWAAVGTWLGKDRRFARLPDLHHGKRVPPLAASADFHLRRAGEDGRFQGSALMVPAGILRSRASDVLSPVELARHHRAYRWRVIVGPTYRSDMLALLEGDPTLTPSELARRSYGSFATAFMVKRDWAMIRMAGTDNVPPATRSVVS